MVNHTYDDSREPVRRPRNRRKQQVQRLNDTEIQALKTLSAELQKAVDSYGDASTEWSPGLIRTNVRIGLRTLAWAVHYALQNGILQSRLDGVQLATKTGRFRSDRGPNKSARPSTERRRLSRNAHAGLPDGFSVTPTYSDESVSGSGRRLYQFDARQPNRSGERSGSERKVQTDSERCDLYHGSNEWGDPGGRCPQCED